MATVTNYEMMSHPTKSQLVQFAELFEPLFLASTDDARRQAVAALSQSAVLPPAVCLFIGCQPITIAAIFLTRSKAIPDEILVTIARTCGEAHARAIGARDDLSPMVVDALVDLHHGGRINADPAADPALAARAQDLLSQQVPLSQQSEADAYALAGFNEDRLPPPFHGNRAEAGSVEWFVEFPAPRAEAGTVEWFVELPAPRMALVADNPSRATLAEREEKLRNEIKALSRHLFPPASDRGGQITIDATQEALLVRFARLRQATFFVRTLADALTSSRWLAERILLDVSGTQLATALVAIGMRDDDAAFILRNLYPSLGREDGHGTRADALLESLDTKECDARLSSWLRADSYTFENDDTILERSEDRLNKARLTARPDRGLGLIGRAR